MIAILIEVQKSLGKVFIIAVAALLISNSFSLNQEIINAKVQETKKIGLQCKIGGLIDEACTIAACIGNFDCFERFYGDRRISLSPVIDPGYKDQLTYSSGLDHNFTSRSQWMHRFTC